MSTHRFEVEIEIDEDALAAHDGDNELPPNDVADWCFRDIVTAVEKGLVDPYAIDPGATYLGS